jgi:hypothetical protein
MMGSLAFAINLLSSLPVLIQAGTDITKLVTDSTDKLKMFESEKRDPTEAEWKELNDRIKALRDELHAPGS